MVELKDIDLALAEILLDNIVGGKGKLTYTEVAEILTDQLGREIKPHGSLSKPLANVSELCFELGLPLISARVIYSGTANAQVMGEGFYPFACEFRPEYKNMKPLDAWKNELKLIRECRDWDKLRDYLLGVLKSSPTIETAPATDHNPFARWLGKNTVLLDSSITKYSGAVGTISREMLEKGIIAKPLQNMNAFELDLAIASIMGNPYFVEKNTRGNHMYSNALKQYRYFIHATHEMFEDTEYISRTQTAHLPPTAASAFPDI